MKKPRILVVGSFVMDLIVRSERFVSAGETILGLDYHTAPGGKGANQAIQAALLGADVTMVGKVGDDDFGRQMIASLQKVGVDTRHVHITKQTSSAIGNVQIQVNDQGTQNRIVVVSGANMEITPQDIAFLHQDISGFDMVLLQLEIPMQINELVTEYAFAGGVPVMLNPAPSAPLSQALLQQLTYISPNEHEAADMLGFSVTDESAAGKAIHALRKKGVKNVLITRGSEGAAFGDGHQMLLSPCVPCEKVMDPTAAGDSFVGAFSTSVCAGLPVEQALVFANHAANLTVSQMGAQPSLPTLEQVLALMENRGLNAAELRKALT